LREAVFATNLVGGADTIEFAAALTRGGPATLTLTQGELKITDALVIIGPGADLLTIDASGNDPTPGEINGDGSRIFNIDGGNFAAQVDVSISGLALTGGDTSSIGNGGAIFNGENLAVTDCTISGNSSRGSGGGIYSGFGSDLSITNSSISDNSAYRFGGGILNFLGDLTITGSEISDNSAGYGGGGIQSDGGNLTVTGSFIAGNSTNNSGGGIAFTGSNSALAVTGSSISGNSAYRFGGGISSEYGNLTLTESTISGNSAGYGGGIFSRHGDVTMIGSTLSGNSASYGGGIFSRYGNLAVTLSTISGNSAGRTGGGISGSNVIVSNSTISGNSAGGGGGIYSRGTLTVNSSTISGNTATGTDLFNSGGGITSVYGDLNVTDSTINDNVANLDGGGIFSGYGNLTVTLSTLSGNSAGGSGGGIDNRVGILMVTASTISDNSAGTNGGGIHSFDDLTVIGSTISDNSADGSGGGIDSRFGNLTVNDSTITGNSASGDGGGIYSYANPYYERNTTITNSTISGNSARYVGGIHCNDFAILTITGSTISDNSGSGISGGYVKVANSTISGNSGGGISGRYVTVADSTINGNSDGYGFGDVGGIFGNYITVTNSTITGNSAARGGGIASQDGWVTVTNSTISDNSSNGFFNSGSGGGVWSGSGDVTVTLSTISGNAASGNGGGIYSGSGDVTIVDSALFGNSSNYLAAGYGGGIFNGFGQVTITGCTISYNSATADGGGIASPNGKLTITDSTISGNTAGGSGGGIANRYGALTVTRSTIGYNSATVDGGGIWGNKLTVNDSTINDNSANRDGGGIFSRFGGLTMLGSTLSGNTARNGSGGGIYVFDATSAIRHSTVTANSAVNGGGGAFIFGGSLALDHTILAANVTSFGIGPDLTGLVGTAFDVRFSLIGNNANSGLAATPSGLPDVNGNLIGPVVSVEPLLVNLDVAAMGDFEAGPDGDSFLFEYSLDGGAFQPLFTSSVDEAASQTYFMVSGTQVVRDDPLSVNGVVLNNNFQTISDVIPSGGAQIRIRFTATNDGPSEAFAWSQLSVHGLNSGLLAGAAVQFSPSFDRFAAYSADPDYAVSGDMFGIRSRAKPGIPGLPSDIADDSSSNFPGDTQGIINQFYAGQFFGVVDTVNGVGSNTNAATWTFNSILVPLDPKLGPLADNGGPTLTHALLAGSPAVDAGDPAAVVGVGGVPQFDQRGAPFGRVFAGRVDVGAVEQQSLNWVVDTLADESDGNYGPGDLSLREAIKLARGSFIPSTITFAPALTIGGPATILLTHGEIAIRDAVNIVGPDQNLLTIDAAGNDPTPDEKNGDGSRIFYIDDDFATQADVSIAGLTLTGGDAYGSGAIFSSENLTVTASIVSGNNGGGIICISGNLTVSGSTISGNAAVFSGGGIFGSNVTVIGSTISGNAAVFSGGGIFGGTVTVTNSTISGNSAINGGGIGSYSGNVTVTNSTISGNSATRGGGGISGSYVKVTNSTISGNSATNFGGGVFAASASIIDSTINDNSTGGSGGGIVVLGNLTVTLSTISGNSAGLRGGGIFNGYSGNTMLTSSTITNNEAPDGQGSGVASNGFTSPYYYNSTRTEVRSTIIAGNVHSDVDVVNGPTNTFESHGYNLIGTGNAVGVFVEPGDQTGVVDPLLGPLTDNGGPTLTHALLPDSPAIDAGDPAAVAGMNGVPAFDQRGAPFGRVFDSDGVGGARIDVGAFELPPLPPALLGDYNRDGIVNAADYTLWRDKLKANVTPYSGADGSGNGMVDAADYGVWKSHFGQTVGSGGGAPVSPSHVADAEPLIPLAIVASPPATLPVSETPAALPTDAVFMMLGQQTPARVTDAVTKTALRKTAVDAAVSDSLLLVRLRRDGPTPAKDSDQLADHRLQDTHSRRERTRGLDVKWRSVVPGSTVLTEIVV
jgi:Right handed beta helix region/Chlamydia polymorphic membrane protein (Chlamydia_PMP) repeat